MSPKTVIRLLIITIVVFGAAIFAVIDDQVQKVEVGEREFAFPKLVEHINEVAVIEIASKGERFTVIGEGSTWGVVEKNNYAVPRATIRNFILSLSELRLVEPKTAMADRYQRLEIADIDQEDGAGIGVTLMDKSGTVLADAIIGRRKYFLYVDGRGGTYLRRAGEAQSWLAEGEMDFDGRSKDWMERLTFEVDLAIVRRITITQPTGAKLQIEKATAEDEHFAVEGAPDDRALKTETEADRLAQVVQKFEFADVLPADQKALEGAMHRAVYTSFDGTRIRFQVMTDPEPEDKKPNLTVDPIRWAIISADVGPDVTDDTREAATALADRINAVTNGWIFQLEDLDGRRTTKALLDLYKQPGER
jgi:hypothetical protein